MNYSEFKSGPPRSIMSALGPDFLSALETAQDYNMFRCFVIALNNANLGCVGKAARKYGKVCSPGERELLKAMLLLLDFPHVADQIAGSKAYINMTRCGGEFRKAFAACVLRAGY